MSLILSRLAFIFCRFSAFLCFLFASDAVAVLSAEVYEVDPIAEDFAIRALHLVDPNEV